MLKERSWLLSEYRSEREKPRLEWKAYYLYHELMKYLEKHPELTA